MDIAQTPDELIQQLLDIEVAAEDILTDREQIVHLDAKRNSNREGYRAITGELQNNKKHNQKAWVCFGNMFIKMDKKMTKNLIYRDQQTLDKEIMDLRDGLKHKVDRLMELEQGPALKGFSLKPLKKNELLVVPQSNIN